MDRFAAPWWLPGGNAQTIWPALFSRRHPGTLPTPRRERWTTPDQDFIDVDFHDPPRPDAPWLVLFPGLAICLTVWSLNVLGDALRDALDPRLRRA